MANVQQIAQNAVDIAGLGELESVVDANSKLSRQMRRLFNQVGRDIALMKNAFEQGWVALTREHEFTTDTDVEEYAFPDDFVELVGGTVWDRDSYYEARGPLTPHEWQAVRSGLVESATLTPRYRLRRSANGAKRAFFIDPIPAGGDELVFEYLSNSWLDSDGTPSNVILSDADTVVFDEDMVEKQLVWRFLRARRLSYGVEQAIAEDNTRRIFGTDAGSRKIVLSPRRHSYPNVPESGFGE